MRKVQISELVDRVPKWNPPMDAPSEEFVYVDLSSIDNVTKIITETTKIKGFEAPSRARQLIKYDDVIVSTVRPNLNGVAYVPEELDGSTASTGFCVLRPKVGILNPRYLFHWVKSSEFIDNMTMLATGASYPAVSDKIVQSSKIPLPPLEEQKRIAAILDKADELRRLRQESIKKLNTLSQSIFYEMFGDPEKNPKSFKKVPLGELIKVRSGDGLTAEKQKGGAFPVFGGNGINGWHDSCNVPKDTIIIGRVGVYCGSIHLTTKESWVTDNALIVRILSKSLNLIYLSEALKISNLNQYAGRSAQPLVSGSRIYPVEILVPDLTLQTKFEKAILSLKDSLSMFIESEKIIDNTFQSLQHRAFNGEL